MISIAGEAQAVERFKADTVKLAYSSNPTGDLHKTSLPSTVETNNTALGPQILKGAFSSDPTTTVELFAYCVDIFQNAGATTFTVVSLLDYLGGNTGKYDLMAALLTAEGARENKHHDAAVQLAVWELMNETLTPHNPVYDIDKVTYTTKETYWSMGRQREREVTTTPGQFWVEDVQGGVGVLADADAFLAAAVANAGKTAPGYNFFVAKSGDKQDFVYWTYTPTTPPVPEPATWAMMMIGFGAIGYSMRSRRRRSMAVSFG